MSGQDTLLPEETSRIAMPSRRTLLTGAVLSASAVALMGGRDALAATAKATAEQVQADARILNTALGAELEAIAAYQAGAETKLLSAGALKLALQFQGHHREHAEALARAIEKLGAKPAQAKAVYTFPVDTLKSEVDVLRFAGGLERGAVAAYLGAVPLFNERAFAQVAASILGDEAMHWAVLRQAVGENPVPAAFMS